MYLSRLILNAGHPRTKSEFDRPYELHRTICNAWEDLKSARILFRSERVNPQTVTVIVQSLTEPDWSRVNVPSDYMREIEGPKRVDLNGLRLGQCLRFRIRCRPSKRIGKKGEKDLGKRKGLTGPCEILEWLHRKAQTNGFEVKEAGFDRIYWQDSKNGVKEKLLGGVIFNGVLEVVDSEKLRQVVKNGIGPQKAFGFGLLSLAPVGS